MMGGWEEEARLYEARFCGGEFGREAVLVADDEDFQSAPEDWEPGPGCWRYLKEQVHDPSEEEERAFLEGYREAVALAMEPVWEGGSR